MRRAAGNKAFDVSRSFSDDRVRGDYCVPQRDRGKEQQMRRGHGLFAAALVVLVASGPLARADAVTDQIHQALKAYGKNDLGAAATALDTATTLIRQKQTEAWKRLLPNPVAGWTARKPEGSALSPAVFGGALTVSRKYRKGNAVVTVSIVANSPMIQAVASFLTGGLGSMLGAGDLVIIGGRRVLHTKSDNSYETLVNKAVLVKVEGNPAANDADLRQYIGAIDFAAVKRLAS
jgi:hypothetical protein